MTEKLIIAIDAMGGDRAPEIVLDGLVAVLARRPDVHFQLHGPEAVLGPSLAIRPNLAAAASIVHAESVVAMDVKPAQAMRSGKGSSMWNAIAAVEQAAARGIVSAGNTGALMAIAMLQLRTQPGVRRPALVASWPTPEGFASVLDVGANVEADAEMLVEFAIMGEAYHRALWGLAKPKVGLLNVGSEEQKGHESLRQAAKLLRDAPIDIDFHGFVEGDDISAGAVDVIVTDGFTGNVALKTAEGAARLIGRFLKEALTSSLFGQVGGLIAYPALAALKERLDPSSVNGGVFLGLNGLVVKSHGGADAKGFAAAVEVAVRMAGSHYREEVAANLARIVPAEAPAGPAA